jgi:hypothetical protein
MQRGLGALAARGRIGPVGDQQFGDTWFAAGCRLAQRCLAMLVADFVFCTGVEQETDGLEPTAHGRLVQRGILVGVRSVDVGTVLQ